MTHDELEGLGTVGGGGPERGHRRFYGEADAVSPFCMARNRWT